MFLKDCVNIFFISVTECEFKVPFKFYTQSECLTFLTLAPALLYTIRWKGYISAVGRAVTAKAPKSTALCD